MNEIDGATDAENYAHSCYSGIYTRYKYPDRSTGREWPMGRERRPECKILV